MGYSKQPKYMAYIYIIIGAVLIATSVNAIYEPLGMVTGGITGLAIVVKFYTEMLIEGGVPIWLSNIVLNIPLFIIAIIIKGWKYVGKTAFATVCLSLALYIIPNLDLISDDLLLASVFGGLVGGIGMGFVLAVFSTTGGTDLLAVILHKFMRHYSVAKIIVVLDGMIVLLGAVVFGVPKALYAVIAVYISGKVTDSIIEGMKFAKLAYIISDKNDEIADVILHELNRGITGVHATGMYYNKEKRMLMCVVSRKEIVQVIDAVVKIDSNAFVIVNDVREVLGEGFIEYKQ